MDAMKRKLAKGKLRVAIDLDGTLCDTLTTVKTLTLQKLKQPKISWPDSSDYYAQENSLPPELRGLAKPIVDALFSNPDVFSSAKPFVGAQAFVDQVAADFDLVGYITRRPPNTLALTARWLAKHGFAKPDQVFIASDDKSKSSLCKQYDVMAMVEDNPRELVDLCSHKIYVALIDRPYNRAGPMPGSNGLQEYWWKGWGFGGTLAALQEIRVEANATNGNGRRGKAAEANLGEQRTGVSG